MLNNRQETAQELKTAFDTVAPFIQKHTAIVCPACEKVCCVNRHGYYDSTDTIFITALVGAPLEMRDGKDTDPCRYLSEKGCSRERWQRPFRCTWFFCGPLLESMKNDSVKVYRDFIASFQELIAIRQKLGL